MTRLPESMMGFATKGQRFEIAAFLPQPSIAYVSRFRWTGLLEAVSLTHYARQ
jgi:hypothetical protein